MGSSATLGWHEHGILDRGKLLVEDIRSGRQGLFIIRHELQRGPMMESSFLSVVTDVNHAKTGGVEEHRACLGRFCRGDIFLIG